MVPVLDDRTCLCELSMHGIDHWNFSRIADTDAIGSDADDCAMLLVCI
jgi:hypothetical protein